MPRHVRKGDTVMVIAGDHKGKTGEVLRVIPKTDRVVVKGLNLHVKHIKPSRLTPQGGVVSREASIHMSNVQPLGEDGKPSRVRFQVRDDGSKVRVAAKGGKVLGTVRGAQYYVRRTRHTGRPTGPTTRKAQAMAKDSGKGGKQGKGGGKGAGGAAEVVDAPAPAGIPRLKQMYDDQVRAKVAEKFGLKNPMAQPRLEKITINVNMGRHLDGGKLPANIKQTVNNTLVAISGQRPILIKSKKSVSNFKLRAGMDNSSMVTLRRQRMWYFLDRFIHLATPRIKDFRGLSVKAFDRQGNYSVGLNEQGVFPEINMAEVEFTHGMNINFVFSKSSPEKSRFVLEALGMPFQKPEDK